MAGSNKHTFEIQHQTQHLWEATPRWNFIVRHDTLSRAVLGLNRILRPFPGTDTWKAEDCRIAVYDSKGRLVASYDRYGNIIETFTAPLVIPKKLAAAA